MSHLFSITIWLTPILRFLFILPAKYVGANISFTIQLAHIVLSYGIDLMLFGPDKWRLGTQILSTEDEAFTNTVYFFHLGPIFFYTGKRKCRCDEV